MLAVTPGRPLQGVRWGGGIRGGGNVYLKQGADRFNSIAFLLLVRGSDPDEAWDTWQTLAGNGWGDADAV